MVASQRGRHPNTRIINTSTDWESGSVDSRSPGRPGRARQSGRLSRDQEAKKKPLNNSPPQPDPEWCSGRRSGRLAGTDWNNSSSRRRSGGGVEEGEEEGEDEEKEEVDGGLSSQ